MSLEIWLETGCKQCFTQIIKHESYLFIYLGFCVALITVQVISQWVVGRAEETSTNSWLRFCTVNWLPTANTFPLEVGSGTEHWPQRWEARVLPCHHGSHYTWTHPLVGPEEGSRRSNPPWKCKEFDFEHKSTDRDLKVEDPALIQAWRRHWPHTLPYLLFWYCLICQLLLTPLITLPFWVIYHLNLECVDQQSNGSLPTSIWSVSLPGCAFRFWFFVPKSKKSENPSSRPISSSFKHNMNLKFLKI